MTTSEYTISDAISALDEAFPLATQDSWDNSGLLVGDKRARLTGILLCLDITESAVEEAIETGCNLVISHHPLMFRGLRRLTGSNAEQRIIARALQSGVALAAFHTPADKSLAGTSGTIGRMLGLQDMQVLVPDADALDKIITYVPTAQAEAVRQALAEAGAGHTGGYSECSWSTTGEGAFRAEEGAHPFCGEVGSLHREVEVRIEVISPRWRTADVISALRKAHPYEEPAIDVIALRNAHETCGYGVVGNLPENMRALDFLRLLAERIGCTCVRHTAERGDIRRVAICTGSGSEFAGKAARSGADAYVTADMKYHQMADAADSIFVADVGHYESEEITKIIFRDVLTRKLTNFARYVSHKESNPIKYFTI